MWSDMLGKFHIELMQNGQNNAERECALLKNNRDKVRYAENLIKRYNTIFKPNSKNKVREEKSDAKSSSFRSEGNIFHKQGKYPEAVIAYSKSISFAKSEKNIAMGYALRSAALFEIGRFRDCLENIRLAHSLGSLQGNLKEELDKRENQCKEQQETPKNIRQYNLSYGAHPKLPFIVNRLEIRKEGENSLICAKEYIEPGSIIIKEDILCFILTPEAIYSNCCFCAKSNSNLIPCPNCTSAMFCDGNCMSRANEEFHKWECPLSNLLKLFNETWLSSLRLLFKMIHTFGDLKKLEEYWKGLPKQRVEWFSIDRNNFNRVEYLRIFHSCLHIIKNCHLKCMLELEAALGAAFLKREIIKCIDDLRNIFQTDEQKDLLGEIIFHNSLVLSTVTTSNNVREDKTLNFGKIYATADSLINEVKISYTPNVVTLWSDQHILYRVTRTIQKGEFLQIGPADSFRDIPAERLWPSPQPDVLSALLARCFIESAFQFPNRRNFPF